MSLCEYGCGQKAKYYFKSVDKWCCSKFATQCLNVRRKNSKSLKKVYKSGKRKVIVPIQPQINGIRKCTISLRKRLKEKYDKLPFDEKPYSERRQILLEQQNYKCAMCNIDSVWNNKSLNFHYDHINGDRDNNSRKNSRLICPNCHSQTKTYCRGKTEIISEKKLKNELILVNCNINQALKNLGIAPGGTNWSKAKMIIKKYNLPG